MMTYTFTPEELSLVLDAISWRASRRKSEAQYYPQRRRLYREIEMKLRALHDKLIVYRNAGN